MRYRAGKNRHNILEAEIRWDSHSTRSAEAWSTSKQNPKRDGCSAGHSGLRFYQYLICLRGQIKRDWPVSQLEPLIPQAAGSFFINLSRKAKAHFWKSLNHYISNVYSWMASSPWRQLNWNKREVPTYIPHSCCPQTFSVLKLTGSKI